MVEIGLIALCALLWFRYELDAQLFVLGFYLTLFVLIAVIDVEHRLVLNAVMLPAFALALIELLVTRRLEFQAALVGYAVGQLVVMGMFLLGALFLWIINTGRREPVSEVAFGVGDVTLATFGGLVVGYPRVVVMLVLMIVLGGVIAGLFWLYHRFVRRDYRAYTPLAYGPAIVLSAAIMLVFGTEIGNWLRGG
jgi:leader peptidase (prepilin peptidase)/N-methyltransferase